MTKAASETNKNSHTKADAKQVLNNLLKILVSKRQISEKDLDTVLEITIQKLAELINNKLSNDAVVTFLEGKVAGDDPLRRRPDISRIEKILDWKPKIDLNKGLEKTIPYFKEMLNI